MPLLLLGALVAIFVAIYIYFSNHQDRFVRKKTAPKNPFDVIYLPADLEAEKQKKPREESEDNPPQ